MKSWLVNIGTPQSGYGMLQYETYFDIQYIYCRSYVHIYIYEIVFIYLQYLKTNSRSSVQYHKINQSTRVLFSQPRMSWILLLMMKLHGKKCPHHQHIELVSVLQMECHPKGNSKWANYKSWTWNSSDVPLQRLEACGKVVEGTTKERQTNWVRSNLHRCNP